MYNQFLKIKRIGLLRMGWIQKLYQTYEACSGKEGADDLLPLSHTEQQAHIEIIIDDNGNFKTASVIKKESTIIPATEDSAGRSSNEAPHPLCDKIQYCAGDYSDYGGVKNSYFNSYRCILEEWCNSEFSHPKAKAVLKYISKKSLAGDLIEHKILVVNEKNNLLVIEKEKSAKGIKTQKVEKTIEPIIFQQLTFNDKDIKDQGDALIRWIVEINDNLDTKTWKDKSLYDSWICFVANKESTKGLCMVTGLKEESLAFKHPAKIRNPGDKARIISSNDKDGFTFKGRFLKKEELITISYNVTHKAHNALRWLISTQGYQNGDQAIVAWSVYRKPLPDLMKDSYDLFSDLSDLNPIDSSIDTDQIFANQLNKSISGYKSKLVPLDEVVVMAMDSIVKGRLAITFYREIQGTEFLERIQSWHSNYSWMQDFSKDKKFIGAPAPRDIAETAYGRKLDDKLKKKTIERLLPCIVDNQKLPSDILSLVIHKTYNRVGLEEWEWKKSLGIACALFKGSRQRKEYKMALEESRKSRDYLYGRLIAVAEKIEEIALSIVKEKRLTTVARLFQRFADRPFSTWKNIELALNPYKNRLRSIRTGFLVNKEKLLDEIISSFERDDFISDKSLSGEFLLGYHCQRENFKHKLIDTVDEEDK
jgi:CRISPR-associated protein Csd1